jgi:uncharacterized protein (TIGR02246 family)
MKSLVTTLALAAGLVAAVTALSPPGSAQEKPAAAIEELGARYKKAFDAGDADAFAACFARRGEYVTRDGTAHRGRSAIAALARGFFEEVPGATVTAPKRDLRVLSVASAVEEGVATVRRADGTIHSRGRYSVVFTREENRWVVARFRGNDVRPSDLSAREHLEPLAWLVGEWMNDTDETSVRVASAWSEDGPWLVQRFTVTDRAGAVTKFVQRIGWDPLFAKVRSWSWDSHGGFGASVWTPTEDGWLLNSRGTSADGRMGAATHRIRKVSEDVYRWESLEHTAGEDAVRKVTHTIVRMPPAPGEVEK